MTSKRPSNVREVELQDIPRGSVDVYGNTAKRNSVVITNYQLLKQKQQNEVAADSSRKSSRISRGLNPNVERRKTVATGKLFFS